MKWLFVYGCATFACHDPHVMAGNGTYYETRDACVRAAHIHAVRHWINLGKWQPICLQRDEEKVQ